MEEQLQIGVMRDLIRRNEDFKTVLDKLRLPLVFSVMALLSNDKANIFNDKLIEFMEYLVISDANKEEQEAQFASFVIDRIVLKELLDYKKDPNIDFIQVYSKYCQDQDVIHDYERVNSNINFLRQRRLFVTPTMDYY